MMTKPDAAMLAELKQVFTPKNFGILLDSEAKLIRMTLCLDDRNEIELQNIRDMAVMYFSADADITASLDPNLTDDEKQALVNKNLTAMDRLSAVTAAIDGVRFERGFAI